MTPSPVSTVDLRQLFDDLVRFETMLWASVDARLMKDCGSSLGNLNVMLVVGRTEACRVFDIAASLAITVGGASQAVDRLEKAGLAQRQPNPADRRSSVVALTEAGAAALEAASPVFDAELEARVRGPLSASALTQLSTALARLRAGAALPHP